MGETTQERERARDLDRFLTFIDAIVAIAVTLLVLPLVDVVGRLHGEYDDSVGALLRGQRALIGAFFLSFIVIANLWLTQHRMLRHVVATNELLTRLLVAWTLTIVFLPLPDRPGGRSGRLGGTGGDQAALRRHDGGQLVPARAVCLVVSRHPDLRDSDRRPRTPFAPSRPRAAFLVALGVMLLVPSTSYWPLLLLLASDRVVDVYRRTVTS